MRGHKINILYAIAEMILYKGGINFIATLLVNKYLDTITEKQVTAIGSIGQIAQLAPIIMYFTGKKSWGASKWAIERDDTRKKIKIFNKTNKRYKHSYNGGKYKKTKKTKK